MTFVRYIAIQLLAYIVDLGGFLILLGALGPAIANVLSKFAAGLFAFVAHRNFTFRAGGETARASQALRYFTLLLLNLPLASTMLAVLMVWIAEPVLAKILADVLSVALTYWLSKHFIFRRDQNVDTSRIDEVET